MTEQAHKFSIRVAESIDRRRFLRRTAGSIFATATALSVGRLLNPAVAYGYVSACESPSADCPYGCGPSQCCNAPGRPSGCDCSAPAAGCKNDGMNCHGKAGTWNGTSCWTCDYYSCVSHHQYHIITTCCDCSTSGCNDGTNMRCISYQTQVYSVGSCGRPPGRPELVGVQTGDPSTSWGFDPRRSSPSDPSTGRRSNQRSHRLAR
jgi:hypothetical protein